MARVQRANIPNVGEIWYVDLPDSIGHEQTGPRPALVLAIHAQGQTGLSMVVPLTIILGATVVPLTSTAGATRFPNTYFIKRSAINGLPLDSIAMIFQLRTCSFNRFRNKLGNLEQNHINTIKLLIKHYLNL